MAAKFCKVAGLAFIAIGILGFFMPTLLGMHLTGVHNLIHLASGAVALYFGFVKPASAALFCRAFGTFYLLLGVVGFIAPDIVAKLIHSQHAGMDMGGNEFTPDNVVHIILGIAFLIAGFIHEPAVLRAQTK